MSYHQLERYCGRGDWPTEKKKTARGWGGKLSYEALEGYCGREAKPRPEKPQDKTMGRSGRSSAGSRIKPKTDTTLQQLFTPVQQDSALQLGINGEDQNTGAPPAARSPFVRVQPGTSLPQFGANGPGLGQVQPVTLGAAAAKPGSGQAGPGAGAGEQPARNSAWQQAVEAAAPVYTWQDVLTAANDVTGSQYDTLRQQAKQRGAVYNAVRDFEAAHEDGELLDFYADPSVKLNDVQMQTAKRLVQEFEAKYPKTRDYDPINGMDPQAGYQMAAMMRDPQYQSYIQLLNKTDALEAAATGFTEGTGAGQVLDLLGRIGADDEGRAAMDAWKDARGAVRAAGQTQHPVASAAGTMGGKMLEYTAGKQVMGALPGVGNALNRAGNAVSGALAGAGRVGAAAAQLLPGQRIAGLMGDQILDVLFDTVPQTADAVQQMQRQQREGLAQGEKEITPGEIALGAAGNFGSNALFNLLGELPGILKDAKGVPGAIQMSGARQAAAAGQTPTADQLLAFNQGAARNGLAGSQEWLDLNMSRYQDGLSGGAQSAARATGPDLYFEMGPNGPMLRSRVLDAQRAAQIDGTLKTEYNEINGGVLNESAGAAGVSGVFENLERARSGVGTGHGQQRGVTGGHQVLYRILNNDRETSHALARVGSNYVELHDTTAQPQIFTAALDDAIKANKYGLMVSPKTSQQLADSGAITFMTPDGLAGAAVTADGDIEAVFKNPASRMRRVSAPLMLSAIENGGRKLDCYGIGLVQTYNDYGFEPVARVAWNPEYAPEGWTYGPKDVYVMKLTDGVDAAGVKSRLGLKESDGGFHKWTQAELDALPEMDYEAARAYRDSLIG